MDWQKLSEALATIGATLQDVGAARQGKPQGYLAAQQERRRELLQQQQQQSDLQNIYTQIMPQSSTPITPTTSFADLNRIQTDLQRPPPTLAAMLPAFFAYQSHGGDPTQLANIVQAAQPPRMTPYQQAEIGLRKADQERQQNLDLTNAQDSINAALRQSRLDSPTYQAQRAGAIANAQLPAELARINATKAYTPMDPREIADKAKLAAAETAARTKAQAPEAGDESVEAQAQAIANYQQAPLTSFAQARPFGQAVMSRVYQLNPQWQAQNFTKSQQAYKDFGSGKKGDLVRSFNVGISHLNTLGDLTDALNNGDIQGVNALQNVVKQQFGNVAITNFNAAKAIVGDEIIKAIVGSGGALADRENAQNQIRAANTPAQLKGVIDTYQKLMAGQLQGLKKQYEASTMRSDFDTLLSDETKAKLEGAAPMASGAAPGKTGNPLVDQYLPGGSKF